MPPRRTPPPLPAGPHTPLTRRSNKPVSPGSTPLQKPLAFLCCCGGVFIYSLGKEKAAPLAERDEVEGAELEEARFEARESARAVSPRAGEL